MTGDHTSKFNYTGSNFYQIFRYLVSKFVNILISFTILNNFRGDTQSGLKGFKLIKNLKSQKFISNKFFLDAEIISFFDKKNLKITSVPIKYKISKTSSIRILALNNILYFYELFKIIIKLVNLGKQLIFDSTSSKLKPMSLKF